MAEGAEKTYDDCFLCALCESAVNSMRIHLKRQPERELRLSWRCRGRCEFSELWRENVHFRISKVRVVENIEEFGAEFDRHAFAPVFQSRQFTEGQIKLISSWSGKRAPADLQRKVERT
jgi:hypothetical protein